jgi:HYR domain
MRPYYVDADDDVDGTATLDENNMLIQDNVGGSITISCNPASNTNLPLGNHTVQCSATDAAGNRGTLSFVISIVSATTTPAGSPSTSGGGITVSANPFVINDIPCPAPLGFAGTITDNVGNRDVTFRFIWSTGAISPPQTIHFNEPGSQTISYESAGIAPPGLEGWVAIEILQPVQLQSNQAEMRIICAPSSGGITVSSASVNPATYNGTCPVTIQFSGTITDNVGNRDVTYRFNRADVSWSPDETIRFNQPGSQSVSITIPPIPVSYEKWMVLEILHPVQLQSNRAEIKITCTDSTGGAAQALQTLQTENDTATTAIDDIVEEEDTTADGGGGMVEDTAGTGTDADDTDDGGDQSPPTETTTDGAGGGGDDAGGDDGGTTTSTDGAATEDDTTDEGGGGTDTGETDEAEPE